MGTVSGVAANDCTTNAGLAALGAPPNVFDEEGGKAAATPKEKLSFFFDSHPVGCCMSNPGLKR